MKFPIPDVALAQHIAALGKTGSGKTTTAKSIVEHVVAEGYRVCVLDPIKSDWWGITSSTDGKKPGLPFHILGGPHGHVPLKSSGGDVVGRLVGRGELPLSIIDMADFEAGGLQRFFIDFAEALFKNVRGVVYLVIEEAHEFAPKERSGIGSETIAIHWAKKLATGSRTKGIRLIVATQRVQSLHNAVLGSCETLAAHRLTAPADQKPVLDWLKTNIPDKAERDEIAGSLSSLPTGTAWICSGEADLRARVKIPRIATFDNTATPTRDGKEVAVKTAQVDVAQLRQLLGPQGTPPPSDDEAGPSNAYTQHRVHIRSEPDPAALQAAREEGYRSGYHDGTDWGFRHARTQILDKVRSLLTGIAAEEPATSGIDIFIQSAADVRLEAPQAPPPAAGPETPAKAAARAPRQPSSGPLSSAAEALLAASRAAPRPVGWPEAALLAGIIPGGGYFNRLRAELADHGFNTPSDPIPGHQLQRTAADLGVIYAAKLKGKGAADRVFNRLWLHGPETKDQVAAALGLTPGGGFWNRTWKAIRGNALFAEVPGGWDIAPILRELKGKG